MGQSPRLCDAVDVDEDIREHLPAYCAGSLPERAHDRIESAILTSPELLVEMMELMTVNEHLLQIRERIDADVRQPSAGD